ALDKAVNPERPLSKAGIEQSSAVALQIHASDITVSQIFHSGKLRARQTAEIFAEHLSVTSVTAIDKLSPNDDVTLIAQNLQTNDALYVGHLPHLEKLVSYLVTGNANANIIKFQNSAVVCLETSENHYQLRWYLTPELV
ncbi:MAG: phosphohistidine phosphatase SixA, partial [Proteobacteria bacterium]|nr:phosphohistidine phosphatase SixA [Pseudomonadota bacterium]